MFDALSSSHPYPSPQGHVQEHHDGKPEHGIHKFGIYLFCKKNIAAPAAVTSQVKSVAISAWVTGLYC